MWVMRRVLVGGMGVVVSGISGVGVVISITGVLVWTGLGGTPCTSAAANRGPTGGVKGTVETAFFASLRR